MKKLSVSLVCVFMVLAMMPAMAFANTSENTVATVGEKQYTSLQDALKDEAAYFFTPIKLTKDVELTEPLTINPERETVIDLDGHNLTTVAQDGILINVKQETGLVIVNGNNSNKAGNLKGKISADRNSAIVIAKSLFDEDISIDCANQENVKGLSFLYVGGDNGAPEGDNEIECIRTDIYSSGYDAIFWHNTFKNNEGIYFPYYDNADELAQIAGTDTNFTKVANMVGFTKMDPELYVRLEKGDFSAYNEFQNALMNGVTPEINGERWLPVEIGDTLNQALDKEEQHVEYYASENSMYLFAPFKYFLANTWGSNAYEVA